MLARSNVMLQKEIIGVNGLNSLIYDHLNIKKQIYFTINDDSAQPWDLIYASRTPTASMILSKRA